MMTALPQCHFKVPEAWHVDTQERTRVIDLFKQIAQEEIGNIKVLMLGCSNNIHQEAPCVAKRRSGIRAYMTALGQVLLAIYFHGWRCGVA
jgi:hypothetical protein